MVRDAWIHASSIQNGDIEMVQPWLHSMLYLSRPVHILSIYLTVQLVQNVAVVRPVSENEIKKEPNYLKWLYLNIPCCYGPTDMAAWQIGRV